MISTVNERIAKSLVVAGKVALALFDGASAAQLIDRATGAQIARRRWHTRLEQSHILLELLVGEECEREAHEDEPGPGHEARCILCHAHEVLDKDCPTISELIDATEQVLCRIDDYSIVDEAGTKLDFTGLGEVLTFWGKIE